MTNPRPHPLALIILDGWGFRAEREANAIAQASKPNWEHFLANYPHELISGSGRCVGLPDGQMGNSEVGHLNMGAGRIVHQDLTRIDLAIETGEFFNNEILISALQLAKQTHKAVHILGLLSPGGVHSHEKHLHALITLAAKFNLAQVNIHAFLDGRDTPPMSALNSLIALDQHCQTQHCGKIVSLIGRYFAMDRDKRWDRVEQAYQLLVYGQANFQAATAVEGLEQAYAREESDEFVQATTIHAPDAQAITINDGDVVIFMNFRSDRARELTQSLIDPLFREFPRTGWPQLGRFVCLAEYDNRFTTAHVVFPPNKLENILGEYLSKQGLKQLRLAETEKYAHVTFFFNGGREEPYPGEERILVPSPKVVTYDLQPAMSALELTDQLIKAITNQQYDVIICNFANPDMVGHTGNFAATVQAINIIDTCLGRIHTALQQVAGEALITADHGNAEQMFDYVTKQPHTAHTSDPVPFIYLGRKAKIVKKDGKLSDIAPTMLYLLQLPQPPEMTGHSLIRLE